MSKIKSLVVASVAVVMMLFTGMAQAAGERALFNFKSNDATDAVGWSNHTQDGGGSIPGSGKLTMDGFSFSTSSAGNFFNNNTSKVANDYEVGTYTSYDGTTTYDTIVDEVRATLALEDDIPFDANIYMTGLMNGGYNNHVATIEGLIPLGKYVIYIGFGRKKNDGANQTAGFTLLQGGYASAEKIEYVVTVNGTNTSATPAWTSFSADTNIGPGVDGLMMVRLSNIVPNSEGKVQFKMTGVKGQINFLAVKKLDGEVEEASATILADFDDRWENITWDDDPPTSDALVTLTFEGSATIDLGSDIPQGAMLSLTGGVDGGVLTIKGSPDAVGAFAAKASMDTAFLNSLVYEYDATAGFDASGILGAIKSAGDKVAFKFVGDGDCGVTLPFGSSTATLGTHIILAGGTHTMTWQNGNTKFGTNGTNDNPTLWITDGATLNLSAKDLSGWSGDVSVDGVVRVDDGSTLNITQIESSTFFYHQRFYLEPGSLTTFNFDANTAGNGESRFRIRGGAVAGREQIYVPASEEQSFARPAVIRQLGEGAFHLGSDGTRGCAVYVGKNSKLQFDASLSTWTGNTPYPILKKNGEGAIEVTRVPTTGSQCGPVTLDMTDGIISLTGTIGLGSATIAKDVSYIFLSGTDEDTPVGIATTVTAPSDKVLNKNVYVAGADATVEPTMIENKTLVYAENTVAYSKSMLYDTIDSEEISVAEIVDIFAPEIDEPTEVQVGFNCETDPVTLYFAAGDLALLQEAKITKVYVQRNFEETEAITLKVQPTDDIDAEEYSALAEMFDFTDVGWLLDGRESYVAQEGEDVTASKINAKLLGFEGYFMLYLNGGNFILDDLLLCEKVVIISEKDVTVTNESELTGQGLIDELAKLDLTGIEGMPIWDIPIVDSGVCLYDWTFMGAGSGRRSDASRGKKADTLEFDTNYDASNSYLTGESFKYGYAVKTQSTPYSTGGITYPAETWSCMVAGILPNIQNGALITFGTRDGGVIGLIAGKDENEVKIVRTTGKTQYETLATMGVPNATTTSHTYIFTKTPTKIIVYLDGQKWNETTVNNPTFGNQVQIGSVHGNTESTGIVQVKEATNDTSIQAVRIYEYALGPQALAALSDEFKYVSPFGTYTRTFEGEENWVAEDAWSKEGEEEEKFAEPESGAVVELSANGAAQVTIDTVTDCESLTFMAADGAIDPSFTFVGDIDYKVTNDGATFINVPITINGFALSITGGPTKLGDNGSLTFDFSTAQLAQYAGNTLKLTGPMDEDERVVFVAPADGSYCAAEMSYSEGCYWVTVTSTREPVGTEIYLASKDEEVMIEDTTAFVDGEGNPIPRIIDDTLIINNARTLTFASPLAVALTNIVIVNEGAVKFGDARYGEYIKIDEGAMLDLNGNRDIGAKLILNGGKLTNTGDAIGIEYKQNWDVSVLANSIIDTPNTNEFASIKQGYNPIDYNLNGNTITKIGESVYHICAATIVGGGAFDVQAGTLDFMRQTTFPEETATAITVQTDATLQFSNAFVKNGALNVTMFADSTMFLADGVVPTFDELIINDNEGFKLDLSGWTITEDGVTVMTVAELDAAKITPIWPEDGNEYELIYDDETGVLSARIVPVKIMGTMMYLR